MVVSAGLRQNRWANFEGLMECFSMKWMSSSSPDVFSSKTLSDLRSYGDAGRVDGCDLGFGGKQELYRCHVGPTDMLGWRNVVLDVALDSP